jgi:membrane protein implicated in regulation of membrane protease activity
MDGTTVAVVFLVAGLALSGLEIVAPGFVLLPFGLGAVIASIPGFLGASPLAQCLVFLAASLTFFLALRPVARRLNQSTADEGVGARRLVGARGVVLEEIPAGDSGLVRVDRETWRAEAADESAIPSGTPVAVTEVRGTRVMVVAMPSLGGGTG